MGVSLLIGQVALLLAGGLLIRYVRGIPDAVHQKAIKDHEFNLSRELERLRADLGKEIETLRISQEQLQIHKTTQFTELADWFNKYMLDSRELKRIQGNEKERIKFAKQMMELGTRLFFFADDAAVKNSTVRSTEAPNPASIKYAVV